MQTKREKKASATLKAKGSNLNAAEKRLMEEFRNEYHANLSINKEYGIVEHGKDQEEYIMMVCDQIDTRWKRFCENIKRSKTVQEHMKLNYKFMQERMQDYIKEFNEKIKYSWIKSCIDYLKAEKGWDDKLVKEYAGLIEPLHCKSTLGHAALQVFATVVAEELRKEHGYNDKMFVPTELNYDLTHAEAMKQIRAQYKEWKSAHNAIRSRV